jgi:hypothetical protein
MENNDKFESRRKIWLEYIGRLRERELNHQKSSGLTTWAILGTISFLLLNIIENIPNVLKYEWSLAAYIITSTVTMNCVFCIIGIISFFYINSCNTNDVLLKSENSKSSKIFYNLNIIFTILIVCLFNFLAFKFSEILHIKKYPFAVVGIFLIVNFICTFIQKIKNYLMLRKCQIPDIAEESIVIHPMMKRIYMVVIGFIIIFYSVFSFLPIVDNFSRVSTDSSVAIIKFSLSLSAVIVLLNYLVIRIERSRRSFYLSDLELKIVASDISPDDIRDEFILNYIGKPLNIWFEEKLDNLSSLCEEFNVVCDECIAEFDRISLIDRDHIYEINGRKDEVCKKMSSKKLECTKCVKDTAYGLRYLIEKNIGFAVPGLIKKLLISLNDKIDIVDRRYKEVCEKCEISTSIKNDLVCNKIDGTAKMIE